MKKGNTSELEGVAFSRFLNGNGMWAGELGGNQDRAPSSGLCPIQLYVLWGPAGSDLCSVLESRKDVQSAVHRIQGALTSCFFWNHFLCWILSWFLGEMTLNPVSMNLGFYLENGNVLFHRATCPCSSGRCNDWLHWIFYLRKMYLTCFWDVVGGMEFLYQRDESKLSMQIGSGGCPFGLQHDLKRDLTHSVCFHLLSANV